VDTCLRRKFVSISWLKDHAAAAAGIAVVAPTLVKVAIAIARADVRKAGLTHNFWRLGDV
jgi:hypothetical protein